MKILIIAYKRIIISSQANSFSSRLHDLEINRRPGRSSDQIIGERCPGELRERGVGGRERERGVNVGGKKDAWKLI